MNEPTHEFEAYFAGTATDEQLRAIEAWLHADPANARAFVEQLHFREVVGQHVRERSDNTASVLKELARLEAQAEVVSIPVTPADEPAKAADDPGSISAHDLYAAGSYLLRHTFTPKVIAAIAAVLIVGLTLLIALTGNDPVQPPVADDGSEPDLTGQAVATLTAERDAIWDRQPGDDLYPGTRLTLTQGFAEITTARGAIAILEAPASIELLDNDNAIRLHSGKLVGICETETSKGFLVRTPHVSVTDLGTRFGVDAEADATEVHVFEGEVQVERVDASADTQPITLVANQSARTSADTDVIARIDHDADRFAALLPTTTPLPGTGQGLAVGDTDPNWQIIAVDGQPLPNPRAVIAGQHGVHVDTSKPNHTQWVSMRTRGMRFENGQASFIFRTSLDLPAAVQPGKHRLAIRYMADNELRSIRVNGQALQTNIPQPESIRDFNPPIGFEVNPDLKAGANVIEFEVVDHAFSGTSGAFVGLYIDWELVRGDTP